MPIYEYECQKCGVRFERLQLSSSKPMKTCPSCGGSVRRVIQPVGIIFKGSGFYSTDYRQISAPEKKPELTEGGKDKGGKKDSSD
jgi:putative FmdB family regulatory protein